MEQLVALLHKFEQEESELQFDQFSNGDALEIGLMLIEQAKLEKKSIAIDITVNGYQVFRYGFEGTNPHNDMWLQRKMNTVNTVHISSLHVGALLEFKNEDIEKDWHLDSGKYTYLGGGFPIRLKGSHVIGSICVSGSPHEQDHQIVIDVLKKYLERKCK